MLFEIVGQNVNVHVCKDMNQFHQNVSESLNTL